MFFNFHSSHIQVSFCSSFFRFLFSLFFLSDADGCNIEEVFPSCGVVAVCLLAAHVLPNTVRLFIMDLAAVVAQALRCVPLLGAAAHQVLLCLEPQRPGLHGGGLFLPAQPAEPFGARLGRGEERGHPLHRVPGGFQRGARQVEHPHALLAQEPRLLPPPPRQPLRRAPHLFGVRLLARLLPLLLLCLRHLLPRRLHRQGLHRLRHLPLPPAHRPALPPPLRRPLPPHRLAHLLHRHHLLQAQPPGGLLLPALRHLLWPSPPHSHASPRSPLHTQ